MKNDNLIILEEVSEKEFLDKQAAWEQTKNELDLMEPHFYLEIGNEKVLLTTDLTRSYEKIKVVLDESELNNTLIWFIYGYEYARKRQEITK